MDAQKHQLLDGIGYEASTLLLTESVKHHVSVDDVIHSKRCTYQYTGPKGTAIFAVIKAVDAKHPGALAKLAEKWFLLCPACGAAHGGADRLRECPNCKQVPRTYGCVSCLPGSCAQCVTAAMEAAVVAAVCPPTQPEALAVPVPAPEAAVTQPEAPKARRKKKD